MGPSRLDGQESILKNSANTRKGDCMIVKSNEAQQRSFLGVNFVLLSHGPESMVAKMIYMKEDNPPLHDHPNEQSGYVI